VINIVQSHLSVKHTYLGGILFRVKKKCQPEKFATHKPRKFRRSPNDKYLHHMMIDALYQRVVLKWTSIL